MYSKGIKTTTRCAVDVALRGGSEMLFYVEMGTLMIELSKTPFTVMTYLIFQETKIYLLGEYIPIKFKNIGTCLFFRQKVCIPQKHCSEHHLNMAADIEEQHKLDKLQVLPEKRCFDIST